MNKYELLKKLRQQIDLGLGSDLYNCPDNFLPGAMPYTIAALVLTDCELSKVPQKVVELLEKSIEHDLIMKASRPKKTLLSKFIEWSF